MQGWQPTISSQSFLQLFEGSITKLPEDTKSYTNKKSSQAELLESGPSLQRLESLDLSHLSMGEEERNIQWATQRLGEYSPLQPYLWNESNHLPPFEISCETNVLTFVESRYLQRAACAALFLCCIAMGKYTHARCPGQETAYWHDSSSTGTSGRPDRILKYCVALMGSIGDAGDDDEPHSIGCVVEGKTAKVCSSVMADAKEHVNVLEKLSQFATDWTKKKDGKKNDKWLKKEGTWEVKAKEFLLQVKSICFVAS